MSNTPPKWHSVYRSDEEKCVFVGKDGCSGLIRAHDKATGKKFEWRSTDALARESGLSKKRVEEILEYYCNKKVVRQHSKDPEKWGYWELVGQEKEDPDVVAKDHEYRMDKSSGTKKATSPSVVGNQQQQQQSAVPVVAPVGPVPAPTKQSPVKAVPKKTTKLQP